ncbi:TPA: Com family DNA-binding transcriptional regulator [Neisseria weaveri]|nr:Com family DNA-binding transcriptional regulator [uncultured Neisseria sp.]DAK49917.1 MAG TPA: DNA-directed RNA polymerase [Caudoviricetes sp.]
MQKMKHRCKNCNKLLAIGIGRFEIKCPRCHTLNNISSLTTQNAGEHPIRKESICPPTNPRR